MENSLSNEINNYLNEIDKLKKQLNDAKLANDKVLSQDIRKLHSTVQSVANDLKAEESQSGAYQIRSRRNIEMRMQEVKRHIKAISEAIEKERVQQHNNEGKSSSKSSNLVRNTVIAGISLGLIAAGVFVYNHNKPTKNSTPVVSEAPKTTVGSDRSEATQEASPQDTSNKDESAAKKVTFPPLPEHTQKYYVIYGEGNRDNRTELAVYDCDATFTLDWKGGIYLSDNKKAQNYVHYFLDGDKWTRTHYDGYDHISDWATSVYESSVSIYKKGNLFLNGTNK